MMRRNTPLETRRFSENKAARITVQRITVVINRRRNTCAFEGVGAVPAASDMRRKIAGRAAIANTHFSRVPRFAGCHGMASANLRSDPLAQFH